MQIVQEEALIEKVSRLFESSFVWMAVVEEDYGRLRYVRV